MDEREATDAVRRMWQERNEREAVATYWMRHYSKAGCCALCANHGTLDSTGKRTPNGNPLPQAGVNFCICPNGQALRHLDKTIRDANEIDRRSRGASSI